MISRLQMPGKIKKHKTGAAKQAISTQPDSEKSCSEDGLPRQTVLGHLKALRKMLVISVIAVGAVFFAVLSLFTHTIIEFLRAPVVARDIELIYITLPESMVVQVKVAFLAAVIIASPVVFWQIWTFIKPALFPHEGRTIIRVFFLSILLFLLGILFAYLVVFQMTINFFLVIGEGLATPYISIGRYVDFLLRFMLPFGLAFQLPVIMTILSRNGIVSIQTFKKCRKFIVFGIFVLAALLTPPDVVSQIALAVPLILLFEMGIFASWLICKRRNKT